MVDEDNEASSSGIARLVSSDGGEIRETFKFGVRSEFGFLEGCY